MNGTALILVCILTAVLLAYLEYHVCVRCTAVWIRCLLLLFGAVWTVLGICCCIFDWFGGEWISFSGVVGFALILYGVLGMLSVLAGHLIYRITKH